MFRRERLMGASKDTVVVAARMAWGQYQRYSAYICQSGRAFEPVTYMAFYTDGEIKPYVAKLLDEPFELTFERNRYDGRLGDLVEKVLDDETYVEGSDWQVFLLSSLLARETVILNGAITNDLRGSNGKPTAYTMGQRYVNLSELSRVAGLSANERQTSRL